MPAPTLVLKVDADTYQGTTEGVRPLLGLFAELGVRASWFVTLGPDRSGRALLNLLRPGFLKKMLRTSAPGLYGWKTMLYGLALPSPIIGRDCAGPLQAIAAAEGQELGLHAWDHRTWQDRLDDYPASWAAGEVARGIAGFQQLYGRAPDCFAAAAWKVSAPAMTAWASAKPRYQSDCRVESGDAVPFVPTRGRFASPIPQLPTNTPTLDELLGREVGGKTVTRDNWPEVYRQEWAQKQLVCHTIHVEGEGRVYLPKFAELLRGLKRDGWRFATGGDVVDEYADRLRTGALDSGTVPGRSGTVAVAVIDA